MLKYIFVTVLVAFTLPSSSYCQSITFRKINAQTKSSITQIQEDIAGNVYFLTDKIYILDKDHWKRIDFPVSGKIFTFYPISPEDIWFTINQVTNTCLLYHYHDGITENIPPPFSNHISSIHLINKETLLFTSFADIAILAHDSFRLLPPVPSQYVVEQVYALDTDHFFALSNKGELFEYRNGIYKHLVKNKNVRSFCFSDFQHGYLSTREEICEIRDSMITPVCKGNVFSKVTGMVALDDGSLLMVGQSGLILHYSGGSLISYPSGGQENLTGVIKTREGEIWIYGEKGRLLYCGDKEFSTYPEVQDGFSSLKLIHYGISTDDEYGVAMDDFNRDGKTDIYSVRIYEQNRLYINDLTPQTQFSVTSGFSEEAFKRTATGSIRPEEGNNENELKLGVCTVDVDNDNDIDIFLCYLNSNNKLLLNNGSGFFRNVATQKNRACENLNRSNAAAFADIDLDGDLDLFITSEEASNRLFKNDGTGHFTDITPTSGISSIGGGMCASFADVNGDGLPDLAVTCWNSLNRIYLNESGNGKIVFRDITALTDLATATPCKSNGLAFADVNNDGLIDLFIANRNAENKLYLNDGKGIFRDRTKDYFPSEDHMTNGVTFADFDLDGYLDLYITNVGENVLYRNMNGTFFKEMTSEFGAELSGYCTGCVTGDIDNDGDPDLYVANYINGDSKLFLNNTENRNFVKFRLYGIRSNRDAIGAKVWLFQKLKGDSSGMLVGYREISAGGGYGSSSAKEMIFGVKPGVGYYALIKFPSSPDTIRMEQLVPGNSYEISEMNGFKALLETSRRNLVSFFTNEETRPEIIKYLMVLGLLFLYNIRFRSGIRRINMIRGIGSCIIFLIFILVNHFFLYQWPAFLYFISPLTVLVLLATLHLYIGRILLRNLAQKEQKELREKISRDLHDDLASTLGSISIYAGTLKGMHDPSPDQTGKLVGKIASLSESAVQSISDMLWMTSPRNDSIQSLGFKACNHMVEIFSDNNIRFTPALDVPDEPVVLPDILRNDLFLILKEATHNIIKHAGAKNVTFTVICKESKCRIILEDDGTGIGSGTNPTDHQHGHGLVNMQKRAIESGMEISIGAGSNGGTKVDIQFKI